MSHKISLQNYILPYAPSPAYDLSYKEWLEQKETLNLGNFQAALVYTPKDKIKVYYELLEENPHINVEETNRILLVEEALDIQTTHNIYYTFFTQAGAIGTNLDPRRERSKKSNQDEAHAYAEAFEPFFIKHNLR